MIKQIIIILLGILNLSTLIMKGVLAVLTLLYEYIESWYMSSNYCNCNMRCKWYSYNNTNLRMPHILSLGYPLQKRSFSSTSLLHNNSSDNSSDNSKISLVDKFSKCLKVPKGSFITAFSDMFHMDKSPHSIVASTALVSGFDVPLNIFIKEFLLPPTGDLPLFKLFIVVHSAFYDKIFFEEFNLGNIIILVIKMDTYTTILSQDVDIRISMYCNYFIFVGFSCWSEIVNITKEQGNIIITGGDTSRRHLVNKLSLRLHHFLFSMRKFPLLSENIIFHVSKNITAPGESKRPRVTCGTLLRPYNQKRGFYSSSLSRLDEGIPLNIENNNNDNISNGVDSQMKNMIKINDLNSIRISSHISRLKHISLSKEFADRADPRVAHCVNELEHIIKYYIALVELLSEASLFASPNILESMVREANNSRAILQRALSIVYGKEWAKSDAAQALPVIRRDRWISKRKLLPVWDSMEDWTAIGVNVWEHDYGFNSLYNMIECELCVRAGINRPTPSVFITMGRLVDAYLIICEIVGNKDIKGEKVLKSLKGIENMGVNRTSLKDVSALYAYALGGAITSSLVDVCRKFVELQIAAESNVVRLRDVRVVVENKAISAMFPEELIEVLRVRLKLKRESGDGPYMDHEGMAISDILSRVEYLMASSEIAVENARSGILDTQSKFLQSAFHIVREGGSDTCERQIALELLSLHYERNFINELLKDLNSNMNKGASSMIYGLFNKCLPNIIEVVKTIVMRAEDTGLEDLKDGIVLSGRAKLLIALYILGAETVSSIVFSNLVRISGGAGGAEEMDLINKISEAVFINMKHVKKIPNKLPKAVKTIWPQRRDEVVQLSAVDKVEVGQTLLDICLQCCPKLFEKVSRMVSRVERVNWVVIKRDFSIFMANFAFNPLRLPMLHKPNDWSLVKGEASGGYLHELYNELVNSKGLVHQELGSQFRSAIGVDQINAVNYLNAQQFEIHEDMLDYLLDEWERNDSYIFGMYNKPCVDDEFNAESQEHNSLYWMYRNILNIAQLFRGVVFYLPVFMDFRGRIYPMVNYLTYQGGDVARSLISFHRSGYRGGNNNHILIYLCNVFGLKGLSMKARIEWAQTNIPLMLELYENDREKFEELYLKKAKEKAQFMSCLLAVFKAHCLDGGDYNKCKLPVLFDATCSGMQHLSALTTNLDLAVLVNLTGGEIKDFYAHCAEMVSKVITDLPDQDIREKLLRLKIDRKLVKLPVMTIPYNIGLETLSEKITEKFKKYFVEEDGAKKLRFLVPAESTVDGEELILTGKEAGKLGSIVYHTVKGMMPPIQPLKDYFSGMLKVLSKVNKPIFWITPAGMTIWGSAVGSTAKRVKTSFLKNSKPVTIRIPSENYDYKVINRSLMANFIHSMDAANIHYLIKLIISNPELRMLGINLYTIHDCFASVNDQMDIMEILVRKAFSQLYFEHNYLVELDRCLLSQIKSYGVDIQISKDGDRLAVFQTQTSNGKLETLKIPLLPDFSWDVNKDYLKKQIMLAEYFIS